MKLYYTDQFELPLPATHRFPMAKYSRLRKFLQNCSWAAPCEFIVPPPANDAQLQRVHTREYIERVTHGRLTDLEMRRIGFPWSQELVERSRRSVGATLAAVKAALEDGIAVNLAGGTHHAFSDQGQGYCVFNDSAVAARWLQSEAGLRQILIVDLDVHQGNGTASIFQDDATVFTYSMHSSKNYPFRKCDADLDVGLPDGTDDIAYLASLDDGLDQALACNPDFVIYQSGADPYEGDRLGRLSLSVNGLRARDQMVVTRCRDQGLPMAISMGGGYADEIDAIVAIHANTIRVALALQASP